MERDDHVAKYWHHITYDQARQIDAKRKYNGVRDGFNKNIRGSTVQQESILKDVKVIILDALIKLIKSEFRKIYFCLKSFLLKKNWI